MKTKILFPLLFLLFTFSVSAQKMTGDISVLKDQKEVNLVIDYKSTLVNGKKESTYIAAETKGKSAADKEQWLSEWNDKLRNDAYAMVAKFINKELKDKFFTVGDFAEAEYSIVVKVIEINTGFFAGITGGRSGVNAQLSFIKTGEKKAFATTTEKKSVSKMSATVPYFVSRIAMSFGSFGEDAGSMIYKKLK